MFNKLKILPTKQTHSINYRPQRGRMFVEKKRDECNSDPGGVVFNMLCGFRNDRFHENKFTIPCQFTFDPYGVVIRYNQFFLQTFDPFGVGQLKKQ